MEIGKKIKALRIQKNLTQEELADRAELTKGFISQVERNQASPSIATLTDMLECLGISLADFFSERAEEKRVFTPDEMFVKEENDGLHGAVTWLVPDAQKNQMEPILVELGEGQETWPMMPGEHEEFGYVLSGSLWLVTGSNREKVKAGCSFCLHPREEHLLRNAGKSKAKVLWVSNPPCF